MKEIRNKFAVNPDAIKSVSLHDEEESRRYSYLYKKGDTFKSFNWKKFKFEERQYETDLFYDGDVFEGHVATRESILKDEAYIIKPEGVFVKPYITIRYKDGTANKTIYFSNYRKAKYAYDLILEHNKLISIE